MRQQSHGISTMLAAVQGDHILSAYVGDICTGEIYGYHPDSKNVWRIIESGQAKELAIDPNRSLKDQYVLLRERPDSHTAKIQRFIKPPARSGMFQDITVMGGSIGTWMAMLWKGEAGCAIIPPHSKTNPWDWCPPMGITKRLGFKLFYFSPTSTELHEFKPENILDSVSHPHELVIVHESREDELRRWYD